jgi:DNA-binding transcriptional LysR family regulator
MDRLDAMATLLATVEAGSLSAAGRRTGMPLATVSRKISELEAHLNTRLLNRTSRRLTLTDAGRAYVAACKRILEDVGEAEHAAAGEFSAPKGALTVTAPIVFGRLHVLPVVLDFLKSYPQIDIRLTLADRVVDLLEDQVDLAVRIGELPDSSLVALRLGAIRRIVCASPAYLARHGAPVVPDDLARHQCVSFEGMTAADAWTLGAAKAERTVTIRSRLAVNTAEAAVDAAIAGVGITRVFSYQAAAALRAGSLVILLPDFESAPAPVSLVHLAGRLLPLKLRAFLDFAAAALKAQLAELP